LITFLTDLTECPECKSLLELDNSLKVGDHSASVNPFGTITEEDEEGADLVLESRCVEITCTVCQKEISEIFHPIEEH
jgi:hypothetical protein